MHAAILEDDRDQCRMLREVLRVAGYAGDCFHTGAEFLAAVTRDSYDLLLLDWQLPDIPGDEVLTKVRQTLGWKIPVIFVTARASERDLATALALGADDFVAKPIRVGELVARIQALLRRAALVRSPAEARGAAERHGNITIYPSERRIQVDGEEVAVTPKEFALAAHLLANEGILCSRQDMLDRIWGLSSDVDTRTVDAHVSRLRQKLALQEDKGWRLASVYGAGYRLERVPVA